MKEKRTDPDRKKLHAFFEAGRASLPKGGGKVAYRTADGLGKRHKFNPQTLRDARLFARRVGSKRNLEKLIKQADAAEAKIGMTFCIRLLAAADTHWNELITDAGKHEWSSKDLARQIRLRYPDAKNRKAHTVGPEPGAYKTAQAYCVSLVERCKQCRRFLADGTSGAVQGLPEQSWPAARSLIKAIDRFLNQLGNPVDKAYCTQDR